MNIIQDWESEILEISLVYIQIRIKIDVIGRK